MIVCSILVLYNFNMRNKKNIRIMIFILTSVVLLFLLISIFSEKAVAPEKEVDEKENEDIIQFKGPVGPPSVKGPSGHPPGVED